VRPEAAVPCVEAFDHPDWRFSVDWDGSRALLFASGGAVRLQAETLLDVTDRYPELQAAAAALAGRDMVIDGVVGVLDPEGRPDLQALGRRIALGAAAAAQLPAVFLATDLLYLDGRPLLDLPLDRRSATLRDVVVGTDRLQVPDHVESRGRALAEAAASRGLTAILARRADAPYRPGIASPERMRIAIEGRTTCAVAALTAAAPGRSRGIILAEREQGRTVIAGWVPAPDDRLASRWLERQAAALRTPAPSLDSPPQGDSIRWLRPAITATVAHSGRHRDGTLRNPELVAVRDDVDPMWCLRRDPAMPPELAEQRRGFVPTLLLPLPLEEAALVPRTTG
jgi:bifunctional non-homologous end joining protein LigD